MLRITALAGGIGGARFLRGLRHATPDAQITVIGNTADDITLHGLHISPDLDTVMYTLGGGIHEGQGWGRADESFAVAGELAEYGAEPDWFTLGDRDIATHVIRTQMLSAGYPLSAVTEALCDRWKPGVRLLPMTDDRVETHVIVDEGNGQAVGSSSETPLALRPGTLPDVGSSSETPLALRPGTLQKAIHFQEWWVRLHAKVPADRIVIVGVDAAGPAPGVLDAIAAADVVLLPPSNPVVSIGPILAVPGVRDAVAATDAPVVGLSPIIGAAPVRGMADACLTAIGVETSAAAVAELFADILDGWLVDDSDVEAVATIEGLGVRCRAVPLLMKDVTATAAMARAALDLAGECRDGSARRLSRRGSDRPSAER